MKKIAILLCVLILSMTVYAADSQYTQTVSVGDYFSLGKYNGEDILWRLADIDENGVMLISDKVLCEKAWDAGGSSRTGSHARASERTYGSNYWADSNIRTWLNSDDEAGEITWVCGNEPNTDNVVGAAYDSEAGFLNGFTEMEKNLIKSVTRKAVIDQNEYSDMSPYGTEAHKRSTSIATVVQNFDIAYGEQVTDKVFLPDVKQINAVYSNISNYHIAYDLNGDLCSYWLMTPRANTAEGNKVRYVHTDGSVGMEFAKHNHGIRPALYLVDNPVVYSGEGTAANPYTLFLPSVTTADVILSNSLPAYSAEDSGWVIAVVRGPDGKVKQVGMSDVTFNDTVAVEVSVTVEDAELIAGNLLDVYAWDDNMKPVIDASHNVIAVIDGETSVVSLD